MTASNLLRKRDRDDQLGVVRFYNALADRSGLLQRVLAGLRQSPRSLFSQGLHDPLAARLQQQLGQQPEYYLARAETEVLQSMAAELATLAGPQTQLIAFGPAASDALSAVLQTLQPSLYLPLEFDGAVLYRHCMAMSELCPGQNIAGIAIDHAAELSLPAFLGVTIRRNLLYVPATVLSRLAPQECQAFMERAALLAGRGGMLLAGVDLKQDRYTLEASCNDAAGFAAALHLNLLQQMNQELGSDFVLDAWDYRGSWSGARGRTEMHLLSSQAQQVSLGGQSLQFAAGESLLAGIGSHYTLAEFAELGRHAGWLPVKLWPDSRQQYALHLMKLA